MNRLVIVLSFLITSQVAAHQFEKEEWDDLDVVLELIDLGVPADCFDSRLLQGLPLKAGHPAINQNLNEIKHQFCIEVTIRRADNLSVNKRDMLQFMVGPLPRNSRLSE